MAVTQAFPTLPKAVLVLDAPTNGVAASYLLSRGYGVEVVRDLRFCTPALLKSARLIVLNPNVAGSAYYDRVRELLKKNVPERLFEQSGIELMRALRSKAAQSVQKPAPLHPADPVIAAEDRAKEEAVDIAELDKNPEVTGEKDDLIQGLEPDSGDDGAPKSKLMSHIFDAEAFQALKVELDAISLATPKFEIDDEVKAILEPLFLVAGQLRELEVQRQNMLLQEDINEDAAKELRQQATKMAKPKLPARVIDEAAQLQEKIEAAKSEGKEFPKRKLPAGEFFDEVIEMGEKTDELLLRRARLRQSVAQALANKVVKDTAFKVFRAIGAAPDYLYGSVYLSFALTTYIDQMYDRYVAGRKAVLALAKERGLVEDGNKKKKESGWLKLRKKDSEEELSTETPLSPEEVKQVYRTQLDGYAVVQISKDLNDIQPDLCEAFWQLYQRLALVVMEEKLKAPTFMRHIRGFLRFGLMGSHPCLIGEEQYNALIAQCDDFKMDFAHKEGETNTLYPDECFVQTAHEIILPSFDEELELSGQGTTRYKFEKLKKKIHSCNFKIQIFEREIAKWSKVVEEAQGSVNAAEKMMEEADKKSKEYRDLRATVREARAESARVSKIVEKFQDQKRVEEEGRSSTLEKLAEIEFTPELPDLATREVGSIRRFCKLLDNRKENFLPFVIRDSFDPSSQGLLSKPVINEAVAKFEKSDYTVFSVEITGSPNPKKQVLVRYSPTTILLPVSGTMGFSVAPCGTGETGRMVIPVMAGPQYPLQRMLTDVFSDFRFDTSKENAGADLMTSDTVVAGYAKVRWDYRKKGPDFRKKAKIENELNDKDNFKLHYRLYIESMDEAGKQLFYKNYECYEVFVKYIPLPPGMKKHEKG